MSKHIDLSTPATLSNSSAVTVKLLAEVARLSLRVKPDNQAALGKALGMTLPTKIGQRVKSGDADVLCLSPDEWLVITPEGTETALIAASEKAYAKFPHSFVDVSDREFTVAITGDKTIDLLSLGAPRDIDAIPVGEARRTIFDGATVVLWRDAEQSFRMDIWRTFGPHVLSLLHTGCTELAAE